jgi:hypothetical protein
MIYVGWIFLAVVTGFMWHECLRREWYSHTFMVLAFVCLTVASIILGCVLGGLIAASI